MEHDSWDCQIPAVIEAAKRICKVGYAIDEEVKITRVGLSKCKKEIDRLAREFGYSGVELETRSLPGGGKPYIIFGDPVDHYEAIEILERYCKDRDQ